MAKQVKTAPAPTPTPSIKDSKVKQATIKVKQVDTKKAVNKKGK